MFLDTSADFLTWDNTSAVRYESARAVPSVADVPPVFDGRTGAPTPAPSRNKAFFIEVAKRRNLTRRELAASGGAYTDLDQVYLIPEVMFPAGAPPSKLGDVIVELADGSSQEQPGTRWTVLEAGWGKNRQTRRLTCRDLVLAYDLRDSIAIERPALVYDAAGVPVKRFPSDQDEPGGVRLYQGLPTRVQLATKEIADERGTRGLAGKYEVIVGQEVDVTSEDRIVLAGGVYLDITGYANAQRIDELPVIKAERRV